MPLFIIMIFQALVYYAVAVYGGIEETMNQNASDILTERLINRTNEIETMFNGSWTKLTLCEDNMDSLYNNYCKQYGSKPFVQNQEVQVAFLSDAVEPLVSALRNNGVNGVYLILNDQKEKTDFSSEAGEEKIGINIRDLDQTSNYTDRRDLLVERSPSSVVEKIGCSLDSYWEARYAFADEEEGAYYYNPLNAAWDNEDVDSRSIAYFEGAHKISGSDQEVVSYSIPLMDETGYPYAVLGVELTTKYLITLLPDRELDDAKKGSYILALEDADTGECTSITGSGYAYSRYFNSGSVLSTSDLTDTGGFLIEAKDGTQLFGNKASLNIYDNNNPFEKTQLTLLAIVEKEELFSYIGNIKRTLAMVAVLSLVIGLVCLLIVSRHFSKPITTLAKRAESLPPQDGFTLGRLGITEIDQLVEAIEELNKNASRNIARTEFFSRMSHDMRTPMNAIISFSSQELLEDTTEQQKEEYLEKIHSSGEYLLGLINEVLDMTKIESNKIDLQYHEVRTEKMWEAVFEIIDKLAQKKNIQFIKEIDVEDAYVRADEQHLKQVVMNLLSNAVKFTPENGTVRLQIKAATDTKQPELMQCIVVVKDNGIGMTNEFMEHLYSPFEQENAGKEGTGLGLSIAKKLIELMGGSIDCTSKRGEGTAFTLHFALEKCKDQKTLQEQEDIKHENLEQLKQSEVFDLHGKHVLICEDHPLNMQIIVRLLERVDMIVETAENGSVGVEKFANSQMGYFDAVILDIRMPVMNGLEAAKAIRAMDRADAIRVPIIAMTANAFSEDVEASREAGMNEHLSKPIEPQKLYHALQKWIRKE